MVDLNPGSIANIVYSTIAPFPTSISGTLINFVNNKIYFVEQYTGTSIGSVINQQFQSAITDLTLADVVRLMAIQDLGIQNVIVDGRDLAVNNRNLVETAQFYETRAMFQLKALTKGIKFYKARG